MLTTLIPMTILVWMVPPQFVMQPEFAAQSLILLFLLTGLYCAIAFCICVRLGYSDVKALGVAVAVLWTVAAVSAYVFYLKTHAHLFPKEADKWGQHLDSVPYAIAYFILLVSGAVRTIIGLDPDGLFRTAAMLSLFYGTGFSEHSNKKWIIPVSIVFYIFFLVCPVIISENPMHEIPETLFFGSIMLIVCAVSLRYFRTKSGQEIIMMGMKWGRRLDSLFSRKNR